MSQTPDTRGELVTALRQQSSGSQEFHGEHWHPCGVFCGDDDDSCLRCQWSFANHLLWDAADAIEVAYERGRADQRQAIQGVIDQMRSAVALAVQFQVPVCDGECLIGWADELAANTVPVTR